MSVRTTTRLALARLAKAGLLPAEDAALLIRADRIWRTVQGMLRITVGRGAKEALPEAFARPLLRAATEAGVPGAGRGGIARHAGRARRAGPRRLHAPCGEIA